MDDGKAGKQSYAPPKLTRYGSFSRLTLGYSTGAKLDADFSAGTSFGDLTFS